MDRRFRPMRTAVGATVAVAALGFSAIAYKMAENHVDGDASGQNLEQQFNDAIDDTPVGPIISEANDLPVIGKADDAVQTALDRPHHEAEACQRVAGDIRVEDHFQPQYETGKLVAAQIGLARTPPEVIGILDKFLDANGIQLYYNTTSRPADFSHLDWATKDLDVDALKTARFDDEQPDALSILRQHAAGIALGASVFSPRFNDAHVDYLILAGNVKADASATAHDGLLSDGIVIEMDGQADILNVAARTTHEIGHTFQYTIIGELGVPNIQSLITPYDTLIPAGFRYAESAGTTTDALVDTYPEYFVPGPQQVFVRPYAATNAMEHGATALSDMLVTGGIIGTNSPSWGSLAQRNQANLFACLEFAMPDFTATTLAHQLELGLVEDPDQFQPYLHTGTSELIALITK